MIRKEKWSLLLIPIQLLIVYMLSTFILQYTISPVFMKIGDFIPSTLVFLIIIVLFRSEMVKEWKALSISKWKLFGIAVLGVLLFKWFLFL